MWLSEYDIGRLPGDKVDAIVRGPLPDTMIYTPENFRIDGSYAIFTGNHGRSTALRLSSIESVTKKFIEEDGGIWELTVRMSTYKKYTFEFNNLENIFEHLLGV